MRYLVGFVVVLALGAMTMVGCKDEVLQCTSHDASLICLCLPSDGSCSLECGDDIESCILGCNLYPYIGQTREQPCTLVAAHSCNMDCRAGVDCTATCGDDSEILYGFSKGRCEASVGDRGYVSCHSAELCDIECRGSCGVGCSEGHCTVSCADPEECLVMCSETEEATLCPDGETKVCAMECPEETPT
jgi:hypothetical protein